jgi:hypothetical protein
MQVSLQVTYSLANNKMKPNTAYQIKHIAIKLQNTRHITQTVNSVKLL